MQPFGKVQNPAFVMLALGQASQTVLDDESPTAHREAETAKAHRG